MILRKLDNGIFFQDWSTRRTKRGVCLDNNALRLQVLNELDLREVGMQFDLIDSGFDGGERKNL